MIFFSCFKNHKTVEASRGGTSLERGLGGQYLRWRLRVDLSSLFLETDPSRCVKCQSDRVSLF